MSRKEANGFWERHSTLAQIFILNHLIEKKLLLKKKPTTVQICGLNKEHKSMIQVSYSGKYSFSLVELINLIYNSLL